MSRKVDEVASDGLRWADSHCHVYDERIPDGSASALDLARADGVDTFVVVGCDRATTLSALEVAAAHRDVWATVGLHPHEASHGTDSVVDLLDSPGVVAVGEAGLDYHYDHSPRGTQAEAFRTQIGWANERSLPLVIHTREAWEETFEILDAEGIPERTVFHCFTGGVDELDACIKRGAMVSFSGIVTFPSATDLRGDAGNLGADLKRLTGASWPPIMERDGVLKVNQRQQPASQLIAAERAHHRAEAEAEDLRSRRGLAAAHL